MVCHSKHLSNPALVGDPVDVTSGANSDIMGEFSLLGAEPFKWQRYYNSLHHRWRRGLGWGHTHEYDHQLQYDIDGLRYTGPDGEPVGFDVLLADGQTATNGGYRLTRVGSGRYRLWHPRQAYELVFVFRPGALAASVSEINDGGRHLHFRYDEAGHLTWIGLADGRSVEVRADAEGRVTALLLIGLVDGASPKPLMGYQYDTGGNLVSGVDAYRNSFSFRYDRENRVTGRTDRNGYSFLFDYDDQGWCVRSGGEDRVQEVRLRYLRPERVTVVAKPDGGEWTYFYNEFRQVTQIIDPLGGVRKFDIDESGIVTGETDANGNLTKYVYSKEGEPIGKISPIGIKYGFNDPPPPLYRPHLVADTPKMFEYGDLTGLPVGFPQSLPLSLRKIFTEEALSDLGAVKCDDFGVGLRQAARSGAVRSWRYDANGNVTRIRDFSGAVCAYDYASWNLPVRRRDASGASVNATYTWAEKVASITDGGGVTHEYEYDLRSQVTAVRRYGKLQETYEYDLAGNFIRKRDGSGKLMLRFEILPGNLIGTRELASGDMQKFQYDGEGRVVKAANQAAQIEFAYDEMGRRVLDQRDGSGVTTRFAAGRLQEIVILGTYRVIYRAQPDGSLAITDPAGGTHRFTFPRPRVIARELSNGSTEYSRFNAEGNVLAKLVTRQSRHSAWVRKYDWSADGDLLSLDDNIFGTSFWSYDAAHRLREETGVGTSSGLFSYDAAGNLLRAPGLTGVALGEGNQLAAANGDSFSYDSRGRLVERSGPWGSTVYEYDSRDMLVRVRGADGRGILAAEYDAIGRRVRKRTGSETLEYYWDSDRLAAERDSQGHLRVYVYADNMALSPFLFIDYAATDEPKRYFVFSNQVGAPVLIENEAGQTVWRCVYAAYGRAEIQPESTITYNLRFPGHYFDLETELHYNRFRYYSLELGRYVQPDPEGIAGGLNLYAYTSNPLVEVDVRGLKYACTKHRKSGGSPNCEDCQNLDKAVPHVLETADPGVITSRAQLDVATENRAAIARLGMPATERGPCLAMVGFCDKDSSTFAYVNQDTPPPELHPLLKERLENPPEGGFDGVWGTPGAHAEIWAANDAMWEREQQLGRPLTGADLTTLQDVNKRLRDQEIRRHGGTSMPCCEICSWILPPEVNTPGRTKYPGN
jgi:RHS repeat-associated protein